jgi:hypothetical protein
MADSRVIIEIISTAKGLKVVAKDTEKLAQATTKVDKAQQAADKSGKKYHKTEKGIHQSNLSSAKGFSKMQQSIGGGSSGLVGAYATLAANVFAATAAFNALRSAAQVETLVEGFTFLASSAGRSADIVAASVQKITDNALSMEDAFRASAIAITSGFSTTQLEKLVSVGKNASIALGRNLGDSVDRLIRGVAKLEPEILDELGIMVRLDTATTKYAATLGKVAGDLTDFERRQAFLNEAISQGETKYSALEGSVSINSFDKLAGTFANLTHHVMTFANVAIKPLVAIFANSQIAMFGAILVLAKGVIGTMFPVLTDLGARFTSTAEKAQKAAEKIKSSAEKAFDKEQVKLGGMKTKKGDPAGFVALQKSAKAGTVSTKELKTASNGLNKSIALRKKALKSLEGDDKKNKNAQLQRIIKMKKATDDLIKSEKNRGTAGGASARARGNAAGADIIATGASAIGGMSGKEGISQAITSFKEHNVLLKETSKEITASFGDKKQGLISKFGTATQNGMKRAGAGVKLFGAAAINAIPLIGQIIFVVGLLMTALKKLTSFSAETGAALNNLADIGEGVEDKMSTLSLIIGNLGQRQKVLGDEYDFLADKSDIAGNAARMLQIQFETQRLETLKLNAALRVQTGILVELSGAAEKLGLELTKTNPSKAAIAWFNFKDGLRETNDESETTGYNLAYLNTLKPLVNWFKPAADGAETAEVKLKMFSTSIIDSVANMSDDKLKNKIKDAFGKEGISGMIDRLSKAGKTNDQIMRAVNKVLNDTSTESQKALAAIDGLAPGFEELTKKVISFSDRAAKKNAFITLGKDIGSFSKRINDIANTSGGDMKTIIDQLHTVISPEMIEQLTAMGITHNNIVESIKEEKNAAGETVFVVKGSLVDLQEKLNLHGLEKEILKETLATMKKQTEESIKQNKASLIQFQIAGRMENLRKKGIYTTSPQQMQKDAVFAEKIAKDNSQLKLEDTINRAALEQSHILKGSALENGLNSEKFINEQKHQKLLFEQKVADAIALKTLTDAQAEDILEKAKSKRGTEGTTVERARSVQETASDDDSFQTKIVDAQNQITPMLDTLKSLGPDGEFAAAAISGTLSIASSIATIGEAGLASAEGLEAMGSVVGTIGGIMAAASRAQIAEVDKQITAEKNRDGKSKESLAKIKAMEKKKEEMKRKAFEQNKKMQMAETVINTASAIMAQKGNLPMMLLMGVLGAAQLAVIAKTSYQSTNAAVDQPKAQEIQIGKRNNRVDVSQGASPGELAYLRGAKGIGTNANNFIPGGAAGMRRSYNTGGEIRGGEILVGEQGPEVIQARGNYNVIPNERMGGGTTNANFTINAVDAAGVEEVLTAQRGNIISMIREAAHEHGEEFIEAVNPATYKMEE